VGRSRCADLVDKPEIGEGDPLRDRISGPVINISDGIVTLGGDPGLGIGPDLSSVETYRTA
jgi:L-alanine-DL-glutamate epimerase-like enolase superfamily enzyme